MSAINIRRVQKMAYYINLFSPETYRAFCDSNRDITGFRDNRRRIAINIKLGDKLICYMTKLSRWIGVMEVCSDCFIDNQPIFMEADDPFIIRFRVSPKVWLAPEEGIPINNDISWKHLSFTKNLSKTSTAWTGRVRGSLTRLADEDGRYLETLLMAQGSERKSFPLTAIDQKNLRPSMINSNAGQIIVSIPEDEGNASGRRDTGTEHTKIQALISKIGESMGFRIWLPFADRQRVLESWDPVADNVLLGHLPLNYDTVTLRTIENIDVLWIRRNAIIRAFEIEHSTSIYSGLLRMADLMSLQPNLKIKAHIVAPMSRRRKVLQEISRPVFALMESGPMSESCSYLSYDAIKELGAERNLSHMNDSILEDYTEYAQETDF